jgi:hypothetical protein
MKSIILVFVFIGLLICAEFFIPAPRAAVSMNGQLPSTSGKAIDVLINLTSLMITFALAIIGGIAFFLKGALKAEMVITSSPKNILFASGLSAIASVYCGHLIYAAVIDMLSNDFFDPNADFLVWPARLQYLTLLSALLLLLIGAVRLVPGPHKSAAQTEPPEGVNRPAAPA